MFSVPDGLAANQPLAATTFKPPIGALLPGARVSFATARFARQSSTRVTASGRQLREPPLLGRGWSVDPRVSVHFEFGCQLEVMLAGILVFVRAVISAASRFMIGPSLSVVHTVPSRRRKLAPRFSSPPEAERTVEKPQARTICKPTGVSHNATQFQLAHNPVDHATGRLRVLLTAEAADQSQAMRQQIKNADRQKMVGIRPLPADGVTMPWRSESGSFAKATRYWSFKPTSLAIAYGTGAVHANLAVVIDRHERELRIDARIHHLDLQPVDLVDRRPIMDRRAAERINGHREIGGANRIHVDHVAKIIDVGEQEVVLMRRGGLQRRRERHALHSHIAGAQQLVRPILNPLGDVGVGRAAVGRVVLESAFIRRIVRGSDSTIPSAAR